MSNPINQTQKQRAIPIASSKFLSILIIGTLALASISVHAQNANLTNCQVINSKPHPAIGNFSFEKCIVAEFSGYLQIAPDQYIELKDGATNGNDSKCEGNTTTATNPKLVVTYPCAELAFNIAHNGSSVFVASITGQYNLNGTVTTIKNTTKQFSTHQTGHYYKCNSDQAIPVESNPSHAGGALHVSNFALEAYRNVNDTKFYQVPEICLQDSQQVNDWVRWGVGICLVALVIIVLVAYFVGRRRWSERSSYESV